MKDILASQVRDELESQARALESGSFEPIFTTVGKELRESYARNFAATNAPNFGDWPPRKDPGDGHPLLIDTVDLFRGATTAGAEGHIHAVDGGGRSVEEGIDGDVIVYAAAQNFGNPDSNLPARHFIDVPNELFPHTIDPLIADAGLDLMGAV